MKNLTTTEFCRKFDACKEGAKFALQYKNMRECYDALLRGDAGEVSTSWAIWTVKRKGVMSERDLRLFAVRCARRVQHLLSDDRLIRVLAVADLYAIGDATAEELTAARVAAGQVVLERAAGLMSGSATSAAYVAVDAAAEAAYAVAAAHAAAAVAADAAWEAEREAQLAILAEFGNPFEDEVAK